MHWKHRLKLLRISTFAILASLAVLLLFAAFTLYGNKVGNFVVAIGNNDDSAQLSLSMTEDLSDATTRLSVNTLSSQTNATYRWIPDNISSGIGDKNDNNKFYYTAFSFYLVNASKSSTVDYEMTLKITQSVGEPLSVLRFMIIEGDDDKSNGTVYALEEETAEQTAQLEQSAGYTTQPLYSADTVAKKSYYALGAGERQKYTVVIWVEGYDPDCNDERVDDRVRLEMDFTALTA
jgi:hypothetical protein